MLLRAAIRSQCFVVIAERLLRLNARAVNEERDEKPTESFLAALRKLETTERHATLSDALSRLGNYVKTKR